MSTPQPDTNVHAHPHELTRRQALQAGGAVALGAVILGRPGAAGRASASTTALAGSEPFTAAMHVHAVYSEGPGSWDAQYASALAAGADVVFQTDHDFRARAVNYLGKLTRSYLNAANTFTGSITGGWAQHAASISAAGAIQVKVEASGSTKAVQTFSMVDKPTAVNSFRTGIDGQSYVHAFGSCRLDSGARYEVVLTLSLHPAQGVRPRGQYSLRYRFEQGVTARRFTEGGGLVGVVLKRMPASGSTVTFTPLEDIKAIWPAMLAIDHSSFSLAFVATSPRRGVVADIRLTSFRINRARHDAAGVLAAQRTIASTYSAKYGITGIPEEEVSIGPEPPAHINPFGATPEYSDKPGVSPANWTGWYRDYISRVHAAGGAVSWNHPFGSSMNPLLSAAEQTALRRQVFADLSANGLLGADILEVGYRVRGHVPFETHLDLWDTFSRHARFLTGNGTSDDHSGADWRGLTNGFLTGIWAASSSGAALAAALRAGRAYAFHPGQVQGLHLDMLVDGAVPMGAVAVRSTGSSRSLVIDLDNLPSGCSLELLRSPVDSTGQDPWPNRVARTWSSLPAGRSTLSTDVDTSTSCFVRAQLRRNGVLVATGNPIWLLREPAGTPGPRSM